MSAPRLPVTTDEEEMPEAPLMLNANVGAAMALPPPASPPPLDDLIPSAEPPQARPPMPSPPPLDEMTPMTMPTARTVEMVKNLESQKDAGEPRREELKINIGHDSAPSAPATALDRTADTAGNVRQLSPPDRPMVTAPSLDVEAEQYSTVGVYGGAHSVGVFGAKSTTTSQTPKLIGADSMYVNTNDQAALVTRSSTESSLGFHPLPQPGQESRMERAFIVYSSKMERWPCCFITAYIIFIALLIGLAWRPLEVDSDFSSFIRADGEAARRRDAYEQALTILKKQEGRRLQATAIEKRRLDATTHAKTSLEELQDEADLDSDLTRRMRPLNLGDVETSTEEDARWLEDFQEEGSGQLLQGGIETSSGRLLQGGAIIALKRSLVLTYLPDNGNSFDQRVLQGIRDFETGLRSKPMWTAMCHQNVFERHRPLCDPGESFVAYAFPSKDPPLELSNDTRFRLTFNAVGEDMLQIPGALAYLQQSSDPRQDPRRYFPKAYALPAIGEMADASPPGALRTKYTFYLVVGRGGASMTEIRKNTARLKTEWENLVAEEIFPYVEGSRIEDRARVLYSGDLITGYEVSRTLRLDAQYALGSVAFVAAYLWLHTGSLILSICSLLVIFTSVPVAYVLCPSSKTTVASFLSLFLVTGIGCDVVFVFTDFWEQSHGVEKTRPRRLAWVLLNAGRNCLATSLTTAASFFANLASILQPLREFGLFMGLCVFGAFVLVALFLPPLIVLRENCFGVSDRSQAGKKEKADANPMAIVPVSPVSPDSPRSVESGAKHQKMLMQRILVWLVDRIASRPRAVAVGTILLVLTFIIGVGVRAELDREVPALFPEDHNQVQEPKIQELFSPAPDVDLTRIEPEKGNACYPNAVWDFPVYKTREACLFHWCDAAIEYEAPKIDSDPGASSAASNEVKCWKQDKSLSSCRTAKFRVRLAAASTPSYSTWVPAIQAAVLSWTNVSSSDISSSDSVVDELNTLVAEDWETGGMRTSRFWAMGSVVARFPSSSSPSSTPRTVDECSVDTLCFRGETRCSLSGWISAGTLSSNLDFPPTSVDVSGTGGRLLQEQEILTKKLVQARRGDQSLQTPAFDSRRLQALVPVGMPMVPVSKRVDVTVLWGVRPALTTPLVGAPTEIWSFDPTFEPNNPWAQRAMYAMCIEAPAALLVTDSNCWIKEFRKEFLLLKGRRFPTRDFEDDIAAWFPGTLEAAENIWRDGMKVQAVKISFVLNVGYNIAAKPLLEQRDAWDRYLETMNGAASITANRAYHTASAWVRAEAEIAIVSSTIDTIVVAAVSAWIGMAIFTQDPVLSSIVVSLVLGIVLGLAFYISVLVSWKIGSIEVISLVIFVGYSVTYSLHVAHSYAEAKATVQAPDDDVEAPVGPSGKAMTRQEYLQICRTQRTRQAIEHMGSSLLSSAVSTLGSSIFLLFCTMVIFKKLGAVFVAVTVLSILCALIALPAFLILIGPPPEPWISRCLRCLRRTKARLKRE